MRETPPPVAAARPCHRPAKLDAPGVVNRWARFLCGVVVLFVFAFGLIPGLQRIGLIREAHDAIQRSGIDATALFYSEAAISSEAESSIRNAIRYPVQPAAPPRQDK